VARSGSIHARLGAAWACAALLHAAGPAHAAPKAAAPPDPGELARLERTVAVRQKQLDLASGKNFYLVLDPSGGTLRLYLKAAVLHTWRVAGIEVGAPRIAFVSRGLPEDWEGRVWKAGSLDPPRDLDRYELVAPPPRPDGTESTVPIPPLPEEAYPVPPRYRVVFESGLAIEVRPPSAEETAGLFARAGQSVRIWWRDFVRAVSPAPDDRVRIRLVLDRDGADSLYRALPPRTDLLILPADTALD
jgi:hypothetical protein